MTDFNRLTHLDSCEVDLNAAHYKQNSDLQQTLADQILNKIDLPEDARALDIGCGDGRNTATIASKAKRGHVVGVDSSKSMIESAKATYASPNFSHLEFHQSKAEDFNTDEKFDHIFSFSCFHWIREAKEALTKLTTFLTPSGKLTLLTYPSESKFYEFMQEALVETFPKYAQKSAYITMLSIDDYKSTIETAGLTISELDRQELFTKHKTFQDLKEFIRGWLTSFVPLPEKHHDAYLDLVLDKCQPYVQYSKEGLINLPYTELIIHAQN